jgi:hypothetical protein
MHRIRSSAAKIWVGITRQTAAFSLVPRSFPPTLIGELWAGLTRSTPAFNDVQPPEVLTCEDALQRRVGRVYGRPLTKSAVWVGATVVGVALVVLVVVLVTAPPAKHSAPIEVIHTTSAVQVTIALIALFALVFWRTALRLVLLIVIVALLTLVAGGAIVLFQSIHG